MRIIGSTDDVNVCGCCGKTGLKATIAFETTAGEVVYFGVVCAANALSMKNKTYSTRNIHTFISDVKTRETSKLKLEAAVRNAQKDADKFNQMIYICRTGANYFSVREPAYNSILHGCWIKTVDPQVAA